MMVVGFAFLMTFLRGFGHTALGSTLLMTGLTLQLALLTQGFFTSRAGYITLNVLSVVEANFACAAVLISVGATLGTTSPTQLLLMALLEVPVYQVNAHLGYRLLGAVDHGGSIFIHTFGAYFGLAFSRSVSRRMCVKHHAQEASSYISDMFSMIGTMFLWVYWPSFNGVVESGSSQGRAVINTYLALSGSTLASFIVSSVTHKQHKWTMVHVQNATLAGGVAVGAVAGLMIQPWGALLLGYCAGTLSTLGYTHLQGWLQEKTRLHDTCGVHNLHGLPGLLSACVSIGTAFFASEDNYGKELYLQYPRMVPAENTTASLQSLLQELEDLVPGEGRTAQQQALHQALATLITLLLAIVSGGTAGLLLNFAPFDPMTWPELYSDAPWWELPEEENTQEEQSNEMLGRIFNIQVGQWQERPLPAHLKEAE
ncbi:ammonium transporter Rh type B-like isoform X2 [Procambarus clarkii]